MLKYKKQLNNLMRLNFKKYIMLCTSKLKENHIQYKKNKNIKKKINLMIGNRNYINVLYDILEKPINPTKKNSFGVDFKVVKAELGEEYIKDSRMQYIKNIISDENIVVEKVALLTGKETLTNTTETIKFDLMAHNDIPVKTTNQTKSESSVTLYFYIGDILHMFYLKEFDKYINDGHEIFSNLTEPLDVIIAYRKHTTKKYKKEQLVLVKIFPLFILLD